MELNLRPSSQNSFELNAVLIKGHSVTDWLLEIQRMGLTFADVKIYPLPGTKANTIFGCLLVLLRKQRELDLGKNEWCQEVSATFFIAGKSMLFPAMQKGEIDMLFGESTWFMHPEIGLVELTEELDLMQMVRLPQKETCQVVKPESGFFIPSEIKSFRLAPVKAEDTLAKLEEETFPKREKLVEKPLNLFEKAKLAFYRMHFRKVEEKKSNIGNTNSISSAYLKEESSLGKWMNKLMKPFSKKGKNYGERMLQDFENLEERNQKQIDKLLEMLRNNPNEALKYAIPLDEGGSSRGTNKGALELNQKWSGFSIFGIERNARSGGGSVDIGDHYYKLQEQYRSTAEALIREKEYGKAAFVYMKLLKDNRLAAATLEKGGQFQDAASVYLKHLNDKPNAALCYEKGNLIENAIDLYKEMNDYEKTGDMFTLLNRKKEADTYYEQAVEKLKISSHYIPASKVYFDKMNLKSRGQQTLLEGWKKRKDPENCLKLYFSNFGDSEQLKSELNSIYSTEISDENSESFLQVLKHNCFKSEELEELTREMAYEIISDRVRSNPGIVKELKSFNPKNKGLVKDTIRFSIGKTRMKRS
jgi:hypothetical protein